MSSLDLPRPMSATASGSEEAVLPCFGLAQNQPLDHRHTWPRALSPSRLRLSISANGFVNGKLARLYEPPVARTIQVRQAIKHCLAGSTLSGPLQKGLQALSLPSVTQFAFGRYLYVELEFVAVVCAVDT